MSRDKNIIVKPDSVIYWHPTFIMMYPVMWRDTKQAFIEIILKVNDNIIGYAVVKILKAPDDRDNYAARIFKSALFPKVKGEYQNITKEQVEKLIGKVKKQEYNESDFDYDFWHEDFENR